MDPSSRTGVPSLSRPSAVQTVTSLTSRVLAEPSGCLPTRPSSSQRRIGTPVPSMPRYTVGAAGGSTFEQLAFIGGDLAAERFCGALDLLRVDCHAGET